MEELNKRGFTRENFKKLISFGKEDTFWIIFIVLLLVGVYAYKEDTRLCRETLKDPGYQECALYMRAEKTAELLREKYPGITILCDPKAKRCEMSGIRTPMPGMPTQEEIDALNMTLTINNSK